MRGCGICLSITVRVPPMPCEPAYSMRLEGPLTSQLQMGHGPLVHIYIGHWVQLQAESVHYISHRKGGVEGVPLYASMSTMLRQLVQLVSVIIRPMRTKKWCWALVNILDSSWLTTICWVEGEILLKKFLFSSLWKCFFYSVFKEHCIKRERGSPLPYLSRRPWFIFLPSAWPICVNCVDEKGDCNKFLSVVPSSFLCLRM